MELLSFLRPGFLGPQVPCNIHQGSLWLGATGLFQSFCISIPQQWQYDNSYHSISSVDLKTMKTFALDKISLEHSMDQHRQISIQPPQLYSFNFLIVQLSHQHQEESIVNFTSIALFLVYLNDIILPDWTMNKILLECSTANSIQPRQFTMRQHHRATLLPATGRVHC